MVKIDEERPKYFIRFKPKDKRPNKRDDKFELFRSIIGLEDTRDILDLYHYTHNHMTEPIHKDKATVTDVNSYLLPVIIARLTPDQVGRLRRDPNVEYVADDGLAYAVQEPGAVLGQQVIPWGFTKVKAREAWTVSGKKGDGVIVAVIDTGCDHTHAELSAAVKVNQNFTVEAGTLPKDDVQHGTHVMGTICMVDNTEGFVGVSPHVTAWNLKAGYPRTPLGQGAFDWTDWFEALEFAKTNNAAVCNNSIAALGTLPTTPGPDTIAASVKDGYDNKGIIYIAALGNEGNPNANSFMSNTYGTVGISNIQKDNNLHSTSNSGPNTDFCCPGGDIWSTANGQNMYRLLSGTSMASPHASGIAALGLAVFRDTGCPPYGPGLKKNKVMENAFKMAVNKLGKFTTERDNRWGFGLPEADRVCKAFMGIV